MIPKHTLNHHHLFAKSKQQQQVMKGDRVGPDSVALINLEFEQLKIKIQQEYKQ